MLHAKDEEEAKAAELTKANEEVDQRGGLAGRRPGSEEGAGEAKPQAAAKGPGGTLQLPPRTRPQLAFDTTTLTSKPGKVTIDFDNPAALEHNVAIEQDGKEIAVSETIAEGEDLGQRRPRPRHLHLPLHRARPCRSRHGRNSDGQVAPPAALTSLP